MRVSAVIEFERLGTIALVGTCALILADPTETALAFITKAESLVLPS